MTYEYAAVYRPLDVLGLGFRLGFMLRLLFRPTIEHLVILYFFFFIIINLYSRSFRVGLVLLYHCIWNDFSYTF